MVDPFSANAEVSTKPGQLQSYIKAPTGYLMARVAGSVPNGPSDQQNLYWSDSSLLFTTNGLGKLDDVKADMNADVLPLDTSWTGPTLWDRDPFGFTVSDHNGSTSSGHDALVDADFYEGCSGLVSISQKTSDFTREASFSGAIPGCTTTSNMFASLRDDSYTDQTTTIQGVRTYEPSTQSWDTMDPMSGGFTYDANNPAMNEDPSGLTPSGLPCPDGFEAVMGVCITGALNSDDGQCGMAPCYAQGSLPYFDVMVPGAETLAGNLGPNWDLVIGLINLDSPNPGAEGYGGADFGPPSSVVGPAPSEKCKVPSNVPRKGILHGNPITDVSKLMALDSNGNHIFMGWEIHTGAAGSFWQPASDVIEFVEMEHAETGDAMMLATVEPQTIASSGKQYSLSDPYTTEELLPRAFGQHDFAATGTLAAGRVGFYEVLCNN